MKFVFTRARLYVCHYMVSYGLTTNTITTRIVCVHSPFRLVTTLGSNRIEFYSTVCDKFQTLHRGNQTIDTVSEQQCDCTNTLYSYQLELLYLIGIITMLKVINYCFSIYFFSKGLHLAQPLQTASSATDEIYCYTRNLTAAKEQKREKKEPQKLRQ